MVLVYDDEIIQSPQKKTLVYDDEPLQGQVEETKKPGWFDPGDIAQGALAGLSAIPRAAGQLSNRYLRPLIGKESLSEEDLQNALSSIGVADYRPETFLGGTAKSVGELAPALALPGVSVGAGLGGKIASTGLTGAYQGGLISGIGAAEEGGGFGDIAKLAGLGAVGGGMLGSAFPIAGEVIQPKIAQALAGIPKESYQKALAMINQGISPFKKASQVKEVDVISKINNAYNEAYKPAQYFESKQKTVKKAYEQSMKDLQNEANKGISGESSKLQGTIKEVKFQQQTLESGINKQNNTFANEIKNNIKNADDTYGKQAGIEKSLLDNDPPVPIMQVEEIIQSNINKAARGGNINPAGKMAQPVADDLFDMLERGALKTAGYTDDEINQLFAISKKDGLSLQQLGVDVDNLTISRNELDVLKQFLQAHKINYDADFKPATEITKGWASDINSILRENPNYAGANDKFRMLRRFLDEPENSWLSNSNSIASKLASADKKSGEIADIVGKIKQLEVLLPEGNQLGAKLVQMLENQTSVREKLLTTIENAKIGSQASVEKIKTGIGFRVDIKKEQRERLIERIKKAQTSQTEQTRLLPESVRNKPTSIESKNLVIREAFKQLNEKVSPQNKFDKELEQLLLQQDFSGGLSKWMALMAARSGMGGAGQILGGAGTLGAGAGVGALSNPLIGLALVLEQSPAVQRELLKLYGFSQKAISPYATKVGATGINQMIGSGQE